MSTLVTTLFSIAAGFSAAFGLVELRMLARFLRHRSAIGADKIAAANGNQRNDGALAPSVTIQIPLYNERTSAEQIVRAAAAQSYPRDRFDIQVLDDSTDETTEIVTGIVAELRSEGVSIDHIHREHRQGYKAGALSEGLAHSQSDFVAVFDADFAPQPTFLQSMLRDRDPFSDPKVAFAQARWAWEEGSREGWLSRVLSLLLDRHFYIQKPLREHLGNVTTFNGSGGIWRREAIDAVGGWTSDTLTEDLDLSYRCALGGWRGTYVPSVGVVNELPVHMRAFKLQQRRWAKGTAQCFRKLTARILGARDVVVDRAEELFLLAGYFIHPVLFACLLLWPWAVVYVDRTLFWILQGVMAVGIVGAAASLLVTIHTRDGRLSLAGVRDVVLGLCVGVGVMVNNTVGQLQGFLSFGGEFMRTPKRVRTADGNAPEGAARAYRLRLDTTFLLEVAVIGYCVWGAAFLVQAGEALWAIAMVFWGLCMALVVQQQIASRAR